MITAVPPPPFICLVVRVHDGDGPIVCATGQKIRVAGIQAPDFENTDPCRRGRANYVCDDAAARRSKQIVERLVLHRFMNCQPVGQSYSRVVAHCTMQDGRSLACAVIAAGAAVRWDAYWRRYGMGECK